MAERCIEYEYRSHPRFEDMDAYGILHHSRYLLLAEEAKFAFMSDPDYFGIDILGEKVKFLISEIKIKYVNAIRYKTGIPAVIRLQFIIREDIKIVFAFQIYYENKLACKGETQHIVADGQDKLLIDLPSFLTERYKVLEQERVG